MSFPKIRRIETMARAVLLARRRIGPSDEGVSGYGCGVFDDVAKLSSGVDETVRSSDGGVMGAAAPNCDSSVSDVTEIRYSLSLLT